MKDICNKEGQCRKRSMEEILVNMDEWKKFGQNLLPLLQMIDFDHVIVDMLHVLLRIGNKLLGVLIEDILTNDQWEDNIKSVYSCFLFLVSCFFFLFFSTK